MMHRILKPLVVFSLFMVTLSFGVQLQAADAGNNESARNYMVRISGDLERALRDGRSNGQLEDDAYIDQIIDRYVIPHIDQDALSARIFKPRWQDIVAQNKAAEARDAVLSSLRRTYRFALTSYDGETIEVSKTRKKATYSIVRVVIKTGEGPIHIDFALREGDQGWRVFDLSVDGVVVSKTLNNALQPVLKSQDVDALISAVNPASSS